MVLEQAFKLKWIERKEHSFFLGFIYTFIGVLSAYLIIPSYAGTMSIAFTSILLIPSLNKLLAEEENVEIREKKMSLRLLFKDHFDIIKVYLFLFFGIFFAYLILAAVLNIESAERIFEAQLRLTDVVGNAIGTGSPNLDFFISILLNNILVFIVCFALSLFYGAGSILFLTINASAWGTFFGYTFKQTLLSASSGKVMVFICFLLPVLPHTVTEALSYIFAAIVGGVVSKAVLREKIFSKKFNHIITDAVILIVIGLVLVALAAIIEVFVLSGSGWFSAICDL